MSAVRAHPGGAQIRRVGDTGPTTGRTTTHQSSRSTDRGAKRRRSHPARAQPDAPDDRRLRAGAASRAVVRRSAGPPHPAGVPHRLGRLDDLAVGAEHEEPVEPAREPAVVGHREHRALERGEPGLQRLGRVQVEVVGRLVEQQQRRAAELEQQDLEPGLLPAGQRVVRLLGGRDELVAVQAPCSPPPARCRTDGRRRGAGSPAASVRRARGGCGSARTSPAARATRGRPGRCARRGRRRRRRPARAPGRGPSRPRPAAAGSATCRSRWTRAPRPARRTTPRGRTAS